VLPTSFPVRLGFSLFLIQVNFVKDPGLSLIPLLFFSFTRRVWKSLIFCPIFFSLTWPYFNAVPPPFFAPISYRRVTQVLLSSFCSFSLGGCGKTIETQVSCHSPDGTLRTSFSLPSPIFRAPRVFAVSGHSLVILFFPWLNHYKTRFFPCLFARHPVSSGRGTRGVPRVSFPFFLLYFSSSS